MKYLSKKTLDWLWRVVKYKDNAMINVGDNYAVATDGIRLHVINFVNMPDKVGGISLKSAVKFATKTEGVEFACDPEYLRDALTGFESVVKIKVIAIDDGHGLHISSDHSNKEVFLMGMRKEDNDESD